MKSIYAWAALALMAYIVGGITFDIGELREAYRIDVGLALGGLLMTGGFFALGYLAGRSEVRK